MKREEERSLYFSSSFHSRLVFFKIFVGKATGTSAESLCTRVFYNFSTYLNLFHLRAYFPKCLLLSSFLEVFDGIGGEGGGADIFIIDQIFNNHKNQISIESAELNVHKIVRSCAHRP